MSNIADRVKHILADRLDVEESDIALEEHLKDDLGADSLDAVEIIMELEDEFSIEISEEDAEKLTTVQEVVNYINGRLKD